MAVITIDIPDEAFAILHRSPQELSQEMRLAAAIEWYREGRVSQGTAAEIAGVNRTDFLDELFRAKAPACQVTVDELMDDVENAPALDRERAAPDPADEVRATERPGE